MNILHITPHLGGGVGKALSTLCGRSDSKKISHSFLVLEKPEKSDFLDIILREGCRVFIKPSRKDAMDIICNADIVQLEWWNHPATFKFLCDGDLPPMRLLVWCHVSGLHTPVIPTKLIMAADRFVFTSRCSFQIGNISELAEDIREKLSVVSSGMGLNSPYVRATHQCSQPSFGYIGSLNFSKLNRQLIRFLAAVDSPELKLKIWGDELNREELVNECIAIGKPDLLEFCGYTRDVAKALASLDVFVYLLNPLHYGTAENALLEAMSAGVIPIVLNNPAEKCIVEHGVTGYIVDGFESFANVVIMLMQNHEKRVSISLNAANSIKFKYSPEKMQEEMYTNYKAIISLPKQNINFINIFGTGPLEWYLSCQEQSSSGQPHKYNDMDRTKGSLRHFITYFDTDAKLKRYVQTIMQNNKGIFQ